MAVVRKSTSPSDVTMKLGFFIAGDVIVVHPGEGQCALIEDTAAGVYRVYEIGRSDVQARYDFVLGYAPLEEN